MMLCYRPVFFDGQIYLDLCGQWASFFLWSDLWKVWIYDAVLLASFLRWSNLWYTWIYNSLLFASFLRGSDLDNCQYI